MISDARRCATLCAGVPEKVATRSVFDRYNIVTSGDVHSALAQTAQAPVVKGTVKAHLRT